MTMSKYAVIEEDWPAIAGHGQQIKVYTVKITEEYKDIIKGKLHWYSRPKIYRKNGMFVKVLEIKDAP
jgi:hypothetical protein